ncbi:hypothetical protein DPMN_064424 [Dreissena polymorpha]|uniref:Uncharacterized protein n=1 Tax=Dreissena polymorpha TaxID=45954 RepID=A0A9D4CC73_DREPO|nr:hypothetical protein DPMN_064424 [Dreissena polymorpha]
MGRGRAALILARAVGINAKKNSQMYINFKRIHQKRHLPEEGAGPLGPVPVYGPEAMKAPILSHGSLYVLVPLTEKDERQISTKSEINNCSAAIQQPFELRDG